MNLSKQLLSKIESNTVVVGIIGLGYVGLPLAVTFALKGVKVLGFEKDPEKANAVNEAKNYIQDIADDDLQAVVRSSKLSATTDFSRLGECDAVLICVPTPLDKFRRPDMSYIELSCQDIGRHMKPGTFVCLESTTYPTTTEDLVKPLLEEVSGLKEGKEFWIAFSPERVDPGNKDFKTGNTPKVFGGLGVVASEIGMALYGKAISHLHAVSSPRAAEMVKILENTYRLINISLINELALLAGRMKIDIWEVIEAAKTKPYGFQAFYPGPGVGGHCIPLDPFYLEYIAKGFNFDLTMINTAGVINNHMPYRMMNKISYALNRHQKSLNGARLLFLGVAYKPNINDSRESPALLVMDEVKKKLAVVEYHDPYIPTARSEHGNTYESVSLDAKRLTEADCVVITTNHQVFDIPFIRQHARLIVDLRNAIKDVHIEDGTVYKL